MYSYSIFLFKVATFPLQKLHFLYLLLVNRHIESNSETHMKTVMPPCLKLSDSLLIYVSLVDCLRRDKIWILPNIKVQRQKLRESQNAIKTSLHFAVRLSVPAQLAYISMSLLLLTSKSQRFLLPQMFHSFSEPHLCINPKDNNTLLGPLLFCFVSLKTKRMKHARTRARAHTHTKQNGNTRCVNSMLVYLIPMPCINSISF
jgi:hypothetical protein